MNYLSKYSHNFHHVDDLEHIEREIRSDNYHLRRLFNLGNDKLTTEEKFKDPYSNYDLHYNKLKAKYEKEKVIIESEELTDEEVSARFNDNQIINVIQKAIETHPNLKYKGFLLKWLNEKILKKILY